MLVPCPICNVTYELEPVGRVEKLKAVAMYRAEGERYEFFSCPRCQSPILMASRLIFDNDTPILSNAYRIFPLNDFFVNPSIPANIANELRECIACYKNRLFTPTAMMCRRTMQGFCQMSGIDSKVPLALALQRLKEQEIINTQLYEWAVLLKDGGNDAAHSIFVQFAEEDARDMLEFTIAFFDFIYSYKQKYAEFMARKGKTGGATGGENPA